YTAVREVDVVTGVTGRTGSPVVSCRTTSRSYESGMKLSPLSQMGTLRGSNATDMIAGFMPTRTLHSAGSPAAHLSVSDRDAARHEPVRPVSCLGMQVVVYGAGAIGSLVGARLQESGA